MINKKAVKSEHRSVNLCLMRLVVVQLKLRRPRPSSSKRFIPSTALIKIQFTSFDLINVYK